MKRREFMKQLEDRLVDLSPNDRQEALSYYQDYLDDAGIGMEDSVPEEIGSPEDISKQIIRSILNPDTDFMAEENVSEKTPARYIKVEKKKEQKNGMDDRNTKIVLIVLIVLATSPIWTSVLGVALGIIAADIGLIVGGISMAVLGISIIVSQMAAGTGLVVTGIACIITAIGVLLGAAIVNILNVFVPWIIGVISEFVNGEKGVA